MVTVALSSLVIVTVAVSVISVWDDLFELLMLTVSVSSFSSLLSPPSGMLTVWVSPAVPAKLTVWELNAV